MAIVRPRRYVTVVNAAAATRADFITAMQASAYYVTSHVYNEETWYIFKVDLTNSTWKTTNSQGRIAEAGCSHASFAFTGDAVKVRSLFYLTDAVGTDWDKLFNDTDAPSNGSKSADCAASYSDPGFENYHFRTIWNGYPRYFQWIAVCLGETLTDAVLEWFLDYHYIETDTLAPLFGTNPGWALPDGHEYKDNMTLAGHEVGWFPYMDSVLPCRVLFPPNYGVGGELENIPEEGYPLVLNTAGDTSEGFDNVRNVSLYNEGNGGVVHYGRFAFESHRYFNGVASNINAGSRDYRAIVITLQLPSTGLYPNAPLATANHQNLYTIHSTGVSFISNHTGSYDDYWGFQVKGLIEWLLNNNEYKINSKRVYFTGFSRGSARCADLSFVCRDYLATVMGCDFMQFGTIQPTFGYLEPEYLYYSEKYWENTSHINYIQIEGSHIFAYESARFTPEYLYVHYVLFGLSQESYDSLVDEGTTYLDYWIQHKTDSIAAYNLEYDEDVFWDYSETGDNHGMTCINGWQNVAKMDLLFNSTQVDLIPPASFIIGETKAYQEVYDELWPPTIPLPCPAKHPTAIKHLLQFANMRV